MNHFTPTLDAEICFAFIAIHQVHLMWKHVLHQMKTIKGGLGQKREDFIEQHHQITSTSRDQHRTTTNYEQRALTMARSRHRDYHLSVTAYIEKLIRETSRGPREDHTSVLETRRENRVNRRLEVLVKVERATTVKTIKSVLDGMVDEVVKNNLTTHVTADVASDVTSDAIADVSAGVTTDLTTEKFQSGARVEVRDDNDGEPWAATIVRIVEMGYEIHYDGYEDGIVETVPRDKILGPLFKVGEHVEIRDDGRVKHGGQQLLKSTTKGMR